MIEVREMCLTLQALQVLKEEAPTKVNLIAVEDLIQRVMARLNGIAEAHSITPAMLRQNLKDAYRQVRS
jgi:hypothetical protein